MKVGDLVKCINANGIVGLVVKTILNTHNSLVYVVLIGEHRYPFRKSQLEVINESR